MHSNDYQKIAHACIWYGDRIMLSQRLKDDHHKDFWQDVGGKVEKNESIIQAIMRETQEEAGIYVSYNWFIPVDCYIYDKRELKCFLFEVRCFPEKHFKFVRNPEPEKQSNWQLFTLKEALDLQLLPSVRYYLESLTNPEKKSIYPYWQQMMDAKPARHSDHCCGK